MALYFSQILSGVFISILLSLHIHHMDYVVFFINIYRVIDIFDHNKTVNIICMESFLHHLK